MASTFTCFPNLPKELQLKIWKQVAFETRNIGIWVEQRKFRYYRDGEHDYYFLSNVGHPAILHTCKESREEGLKFYQLSLGTTCEVNVRDGIPVIVTYAPKTYINWKADRLCIMCPLSPADRRGYLELLAQAENNGLRRIAFNTSHTGCFLLPIIHPMLNYVVYMIRPVEFTFFDIRNPMPRLPKLGECFTFDDLRPPFTISRNIRCLRANLVETMQKYKDSKAGRVKGTADAQVGLDWPWTIRLCRLLCDGVPKD
jgi:hypothetical protein